MSKSKAKGTAAETAIVNYLNELGFRAMRRPTEGKNDKGDIYVQDSDITIEVKNCVRMELSEWLKEASTERDNAGTRSGVVWHKKKGTTDPGQWYVTMDGQTFVDYLDLVRELINS